MMSNRNKEIIELWGEKRKKGKGKYILFDGVLGWGITVAVLATLTRLLCFDPSPTDILVGFIGFPIGGIFWAMMMWAMMEKRYEAALKEESSSEISLVDNSTILDTGGAESFEEKEYLGIIIDVPFVNKGGRAIEGVSSLFFVVKEDKFFIKFSKGNVLRTDIVKQVNKPIRVKGYTTFGQWDSDDPTVQSRVGNYIVISEILEVIEKPR